MWSQFNSQKLIGLPLLSIKRAADMCMVSFGTIQKRILATDRMIETGTYSLHIQCPWRLQNKERIITGSHDIFKPAEALPDDHSLSESMKEPPTQFGVSTSVFIRENANQISITKFTLLSHCSISIEFTRDFELIVFPDEAESEEYWRFIDFTNPESRHTVASSAGINQE